MVEQSDVRGLIIPINDNCPTVLDLADAGDELRLFFEWKGTKRQTTFSSRNGVSQD